MFYLLGWGSPGGCSYLLIVLNFFQAHLALFSPVCLIWTNMPSNPILECTLLCCIAHPFTPSLAHQDHSILPWSLSVQPSPLYGPNRTVSETLLFESAYLCYSHFSLVILPFETLLTFCYFSPTSQFISEWSWIIYLSFFFIFIFSWRIITLQCCIGFFHTTMWISSNYAYIPPLEHPSFLSILPPPCHLTPLGHHRASEKFLYKTE